MDNFDDFEDDFIDDDDNATSDDDERNRTTPLIPALAEIPQSGDEDSEGNSTSFSTTNDEKNDEKALKNDRYDNEEADSENNADEDDDGASACESLLPKEVAQDMNDVFSRSEKLDTLNMSLKIANSVTNQLYSLLYCVSQDCELLITRNRSNSPVNLQSEVIKANNPELKFENGMIKHKRFVDGFNCHSIKTEKDQENLYDFFELSRNSIGKALPGIVNNACQILKDPLVRAHNTHRAIKQKISDLKKSNNELSVQTRHTANRLVKLSKTEGATTLEPTANKSDVIIQQQRLQKALTRVYTLRESNESTMASNSELQQKIAAAESGRSSKDEKKVPEKILKLQRKVAELTASTEQSEEDRETVQAQRRVSLTRMNNACEKIQQEIHRYEALLNDVANKLRIMTQGKAATPSSSSLSEKKAGGNARAVKPGGSKIPVLQQRPK
ncbi:hypothetical protein TRFO_21219 [Tritrichomonas foetus]|uniref:Uncharacterized protein n=1 Tax=Tritrichomonas foetus TaxID=1144522 RepID=A0A1J4KEC3_9EUKA|nr:hypothetical protein TRFO_21219 [Tritrichomonas foetus]|eukprot:OHT09785.1 hypothetical protein TRFO_21219 [Tritrichomonas foetus]